MHSYVSLFLTEHNQLRIEKGNYLIMFHLYRKEGKLQAFYLHYRMAGHNLHVFSSLQRGATICKTKSIRKGSAGLALVSERVNVIKKRGILLFSFDC